MSDEYEFHPLADIFPLMTAPEFMTLVDDIKAHGLKHPIVKLPAPDNRIIDGRNRLRACREAGVPPRFEDFPGGNVLVFIATENLHRRQLNASQGAMVAARIKRALHGEDWRATKSAANLHGVENTEEAGARVHSDEKTIALAEAQNISTRSIESAERVLDKGVPELQKAVDQNKIAVSKAARIAQLPEAEQREHVTKEALAATAKANTEKAIKRNERYERNRLKTVSKLFDHLDETQKRRLVAEKMVMADLIAWLGKALDSERRHISIAGFQAIRTDDEKLKVNEAVVAWLNRHEPGDAQEEDGGFERNVIT
jgi:ParB-like chromosome segregation protein Spo0J